MTSTRSSWRSRNGAANTPSRRCSRSGWAGTRWRSGRDSSKSFPEGYPSTPLPLPFSSSTKGSGSPGSSYRSAGSSARSSPPSPCFLLLPVFLVIAVLIKLDSPGPVIYSQFRVGENGKRIRIYKFRSMREDAEQNGDAVWAVENDPRITRVGHFLRKTRIDEFPQLFNVLIGELDFVGPRPERPEFVEKLQAMIPYYALRHTVRPGITGWAQVMFHYGSTIDESKEKLQYDLFYVKNLSVKLDLLILFHTFKIVLLGRGAR